MKTGPITVAFSLFWPLLVVWCAAEVGKTLQVYDNALVLVKDKGACEVLNLPAEDGCRVKGRLEMNLDRSWSLQPNSLGSVYIRMPQDTFPFSYSVDDYHIKGGKPAIGALVLVTLALSLLSPFLIWRGRKKSAPRR